MKKIRFASSVAGLMLVSPLAVQGAITCTMADFSGTYAFSSTGALQQLPPEAAILLGPFAQAGTFTSDGRGNVVIASTASYNGLIQPASGSATYTITAGCEITFTLTLPPPLLAPATFSAVLSGSNRQNLVMITDPPGMVVLGRHLKQDQRGCETRDFTSAYQIDINGSIATPRERAGIFQRVGRLESDGAGNFTAKTLANYAGRIVPENFSGVYQVDGNCSVTLEYRFGEESVAIHGALAGYGQTVMVMVTTPGWAVAGQLRAQ